MIMKKILFFILALTPSFIHIRVRRVLGQSIGKGTKLKFGTLILAKSVSLGVGCRIGPFSLITADELCVGDHSIINLFVILKTRIITIKKHVRISSFNIINSEFTMNSKFVIGDHSSIFPLCWIEPGEGITIGNNVGVGGHTLMFTHGSWPNYMEGGAISFGPIHVKNNVWLPWRVFVLPNVTIGENAVVGGNSLINKDVEDGVLAAGSPAKVIANVAYDGNKRAERLNEIFNKFVEYYEFKSNKKAIFKDGCLRLNDCNIYIDKLNCLGNNDCLIDISLNLTECEIQSHLSKGVSVLDYSSRKINFSKNPTKTLHFFIDFLRKYGIRLYF